MASWFLIIKLCCYGHAAVVPAPYPTEQACRAAGVHAVAQEGKSTATFLCVQGPKEPQP